MPERWARRLLPCLSVVLTLGCTTGHHASATKAGASHHPSPATSSTPGFALAPQHPTATWQLRGTTFTSGRRTDAVLDVGKTISGTQDELRQAALVFVRPLVKSSCVEAATLLLQVTGGRHLEDAEIGVYPSDESNYLSFARVPNAQLDLSRLIDNRPRGYAFTVARGVLRIDITDLYRTWAAGGPFPSKGASVDPNDPMALVVRPPAADSGDYDVLINNSARAPQLRVTELPSCAQPG